MDFDACRKQCEHYRDVAVFELCHHPKSVYSVAGKSDFHTIVHMREHANLCGPIATLRKSRL